MATRNIIKLSDTMKRVDKDRSLKDTCFFFYWISNDEREDLKDRRLSEIRFLLLKVCYLLLEKIERDYVYIKEFLY